MANPPRKPRSLAAIVQPTQPEMEAEPQAPAPAEPKTADNRLVLVNTHMTAADRHRLRQLALDTNTSVQKLSHEAWNLLLERRGLPPLTPATANVPSGLKNRG